MHLSIFSEHFDFQADILVSRFERTAWDISILNLIFDNVSI